MLRISYGKYVRMCACLKIMMIIMCENRIIHKYWLYVTNVCILTQMKINTNIQNTYQNSHISALITENHLYIFQSIVKEQIYNFLYFGYIIRIYRILYVVKYTLFYIFDICLENIYC